MQLPAFFGHKKSINLLPRDAFESSRLGIVLEWALSFGKWAVIITQLIVMLAFLWRFGLDRQATDLKKEIAQNVAVIKSYEDLERDFVLIQKRVDHSKPIIMHQELLASMIEQLEAIMPEGVWLEKMTISETNIVLTAYARSLSGFSQFLTALQKDSRFTSVSVAKIQDGGTQGAQMQFDVSLEYKKEIKKKK